MEKDADYVELACMSSTSVITSERMEFNTIHDVATQVLTER